jgi:uncharacterized LabA/DUF88 family protein
MNREEQKPDFATMSTNVYIDASNIRFACAHSLRLNLDFGRFYTYLAKKYAGLEQVKYFEGIASNDKKRKKYFQTLTRLGYDVFSLERKTYESPAVMKRFKCNNCGSPNQVEVAPRAVKLKSNVDVFLASEMMFDAHDIKPPAHLILVSCDGDYAELIKKILLNRPYLYVSVIATPFTKTHNYLSQRLKQLSSMNRYNLININNIRDHIETK